jgi:hypothetical protein
MIELFTRMMLATLLRAAGFGLRHLEMDEANYAITAAARWRGPSATTSSGSV